MRATSDVTKYLEEARAALRNIDDQIARLQQRREVEAARIEAFELVTSAPADRLMTPTSTAPANRVSPQRTPAKRAPAGAWSTVFRTLHEAGGASFGYAEVVATAKEVGIKATRAGSRVRVSKLKDKGYIDALEDGVFRVTPEGARFFGAARGDA